jgi:hypothetical protein
MQDAESLSGVSALVSSDPPKQSMLRGSDFPHRCPHRPITVCLVVQPVLTRDALRKQWAH